MGIISFLKPSEHFFLLGLLGIKQDKSFFHKTDQKAHCGINDLDLINARYTWTEASKIIQYMLRGRIVWVFNLEYDMKFFTCKLSSAFRAHCAMKRFSNFYIFQQD